MRVIAGKARRILLKTIEGTDTRPTTDRIKETLFNIIQPDIYDSTFLDLFAGSGAIGIEAISRGAKRAVFVENNKRAVKCIKDNLVATRLDGQAEVLDMDVISAIRRLEGIEPFSIIFMDPPYSGCYEESVLRQLISSGLVDENTMLILEAALDKQLTFVEEIGLEIEREKKYKTNKHIFMHYKGV